MAKKADLRSWPGTIPIQSLYTTGVGGQIFFSALKERGELVATRCDACQQVYLPARQFCERCFRELKEEVKVKAEGNLKSFTFCSVDRDGAIMNPPLVLALVQVDGTTTLLLHRLIRVTSPEHVKIGQRVKILIKPKPKRTGSILDIEGFQLIKE